MGQHQSCNFFFSDVNEQTLAVLWVFEFVIGPSIDEGPGEGEGACRCGLFSQGSSVKVIISQGHQGAFKQGGTLTGREGGRCLGWKEAQWVQSPGSCEPSDPSKPLHSGSGPCEEATPEHPVMQFAPSE